MKDFLKKNIVLFVILILSFLFFVVLAILAFFEWNKLKTYQGNLIELREKVQKLNEQKPYPLKENLDNINNDEDFLSQKLTEINLLFGKPYQIALNEFIKTLEAEQEEKKIKVNILTEWREYFKKNFKKNEQPEKILKEFLLKNFSEEKINQALKNFVAIAKTRTLEDINENNQYVFLLDAMCVPRMLSPDACKVYMLKTEEELLNFVKSTENGHPISVDEKSNIFKVYEDSSKLPPIDFVPNIIKHYSLIEDLVARMKDVGIDSIKTLQKENGLEGTRDGNYLIFVYKMDLTASLDSIRKLINSMLEAYKDNRIYVIKSIALTKAFDEVKNKSSAEKQAKLPARRGKEEESKDSKVAGETEKMILGANDKINEIIRKLTETIQNIIIVVVDDNSTPPYSAEKLHVKILRNEYRMGKGASIQKAIHEYINEDDHSTAILTADADGQHSAEDILTAITIWKNENNNNLILSGERDFKNKTVPFFSKIGNLFSSVMVYIETGIMIPDTQNGLRIYPVSFFKENKTFSSGFAFETETLVRAIQKGYKLKSFPCKTIYFPDRKSHFRIFLDSFIILGLHLKLIFFRMIAIFSK